MLLLMITYIVALPVLIFAVNAINQMTKCTPHGVRIGYLIIAVGAMAAIIGPLFGKPESWTTVFILAGCATLFIFDHRRFLCEVPNVPSPVYRKS